MSSKELRVSFVWPDEDFDPADPDTKISVTSYDAGASEPLAEATYHGDFVLNMISNQIQAFFHTLNLIDDFGIVQVDNPYPDKE